MDAAGTKLRRRGGEEGTPEGSGSSLDGIWRMPMPAAQAAPLAGAALQVGVSGAVELALTLSHPGADTTRSRQAGVTGGRSENLGHEEVGQRQADGSNTGKGAQAPGKRESDRGVTVVPKSLLPKFEDEAWAFAEKGGGGVKGILQRSSFLIGGTMPPVIIALGDSHALGVVEVEAEGGGSRARGGSLPDPDPATLRVANEP